MEVFVYVHTFLLRKEKNVGRGSMRVHSIKNRINPSWYYWLYYPFLNLSQKYLILFWRNNSLETVGVNSGHRVKGTEKQIKLLVTVLWSQLVHIARYVYGWRQVIKILCISTSSFVKWGIYLVLQNLNEIFKALYKVLVFLKFLTSGSCQL